MKRKELTGEDAKADSAINHIFSNALGKINILDVAPTSTTNSVPEGEAGYFSNKVYLTIGGVLKEFSVSSTA